MDIAAPKLLVIRYLTDPWDDAPAV